MSQRSGTWGVSREAWGMKALGDGAPRDCQWQGVTAVGWGIVLGRENVLELTVVMCAQLCGCTGPASLSAELRHVDGGPVEPQERSYRVSGRAV